MIKSQLIWSFAVADLGFFSGRGARPRSQEVPDLSFCRPQTKFGQGNVFTPVCHSVHRGVWLQGGSATRGAACRGSASRGVCLQGKGWADPPIGYYEIRSMIGRYASYWNAFLLANFFTKRCKNAKIAPRGRMYHLHPLNPSIVKITLFQFETKVWELANLTDCE